MRWLMVCAATLLLCPFHPAVAQPARPNILWISCEDMSPDLGCWGDAYAVSPNIDKLATQGVRYTRCFTHAGVCAPSRSGLITGMYPSSIGTNQMRCLGVPPPEVKCFPEYLRAAGYYCTNNSKTDYQFAPPFTAWDENSAKAHWRNRAKGQPFFAVFNLLTSHESQIRQSAASFEKLRANFKSEELHDPAKAKLPPYYPNTPVVRRDWANYHDVITAMDKQVGNLLKQLEDDGLADDTIVWFWSDHGRGLPRAKRWLYDSGTHVPLIVRVPEKWRKHVRPDQPDALKPGSTNDEMVAFLDFAPTMLVLAGVDRPKHFQGRPFLGVARIEPRPYVYGARDRMDETYDCIRMVRDKKYRYVRNFMPHLSYGQAIDYMDLMPTMQEWRRLHAAGKLTGPQLGYFVQPKPVEELYDTEADPHEINNLAAKPEHQETLKRLRAELLRWMKEIGDVGLIPEPDFDELKRPGGKMAQAAAPQLVQKDQRVEILCSTPGASIAYRTKADWRLYTGPIPAMAGLEARACRIGFQDSVVVGLEKQPKTEPSAPPPHWRDTIQKTDLLDRLLEVNSLDVRSGVEKFYEALKDPSGPVRYWSVIGIENQAKETSATDRAKKAFVALLADPSPSVRCAAAKALCLWGEEKQALPVLVKALREEVQGSARHHAAVALEAIGEKAKPALAEIQAATKDDYDYVQRVSGRIVKKLK